MNTQNNKTHKKTTSLNHKHSYRKLRRWVLPAVLGAALSTLAFLPTFAEDIPSAPPAGNPPMSAPNGPGPKAEANPNIEITHTHLNDDTVMGLRIKGKKCFSVQYHPEAAPGPNDATYLFDQFVKILSR